LFANTRSSCLLIAAYVLQEDLSYATKSDQLDLLQKVLAATDADAEEEQMTGVDWSTKKNKVQYRHCTDLLCEPFLFHLSTSITEVISLTHSRVAIQLVRESVYK